MKKLSLYLPPLTLHSETKGGINKKTISIRVSVLKNYYPIFYGGSGNWVETEDMFEYF
jgi:hypothetical protein